jgi:hypothetical protein
MTGRCGARRHNFNTDDREGRRGWSHESQVMEDVTRWLAGAVGTLVDAIYMVDDRYRDAADRFGQWRSRRAGANDEPAGDDAQGFPGAASSAPDDR